MSDTIRVVHYLNQFFAQLGGEEKGGVGPGCQSKAIGPARALEQALGADGEVVATIYCGDNYFAEHEEAALKELLGWLADYRADLLVAGPAFESGRYGVACGVVCQAAQARLGIAAVTGMDENNAGAALYRQSIYIVNSGRSVTSMSVALRRMADLGLKLVRGAPVGKPEDEGYLARDVKRNEFAAKPPAERAVDMLLAKLRGEAIKPDIMPPQFMPANSAPPLDDLSSARIALVTDGGLVTEGNPENMEPGRPTRYTAIPVTDLERLDAAAMRVAFSTAA